MDFQDKRSVLSVNTISLPGIADENESLWLNLACLHDKFKCSC